MVRKHLRPYLYGRARSRALLTLYGQVWRETRVAFAQCYTGRYPVRSFLRTVGVGGSAVARLALGRHLKYSFAFTGEDLILQGLRKPLITQPGFYVDVGCNHPTFLSNTYLFYRRGWRGICVDANPALIRQYQRLRPRDTAIAAFISDAPGLQTFHLVENDVLSTGEPTNLPAIRAAGLTYQTTQIPAQTLTAVLDAHRAPAQFDILSVDVEEHDYQVLRSLDWSRYRPRLVVVEDETFDPTQPTANQIFTWMTAQKYRLVGYVLTNLYFEADLSSP